MGSIKGGARQDTIFQSVRMMMRKGMGFSEAIREVEGILRAKFDEELIAIIKTEVDFKH